MFQIIGAYLSWLKGTTDNRDIVGSNPTVPTNYMAKRRNMNKFSQLNKTDILSAIKSNTSLRGALLSLGLSSGEYNRKQLKAFMAENDVQIISSNRSVSPLTRVTKEELVHLVSTSNTYTEVLNKLGYIGKHNGSFNTLKKKIQNWNIDVSHMTHYKKANNVKVTHESAFRSHSPHSQHTIKRYIQANNLIPYRCAVCGNEGVWNNKPLVLTLDHINGDRNDNRLTNLRFICPNCDRQSSTYGTRNKRRYYT